MLNELDAVGKFQCDAAVRLEQFIQPGHEVVRVRRVSENIVAENEVGLPVFTRKFRGDAAAKKFFQSLNPFFARHFRDVRRRFDAEAGNVGLDEILQQIAVIAGDFHDEAL